MAEGVNVWTKTNPNLISFWWEKNKFRKTRYRVLYGGRGSSKSHEMATVIVAMMFSGTIKVLCARAFQNKISESVYALIVDKIRLLGLDTEFTVHRDRIESNTTKSVALFYGLSRNTAEIKSLEGIDICWIEEAEFITETHFQILAPTIRKDGSELCVTFNPVSEFGYIYKRFVKNKSNSSIVQKINYIDNPFVSQTFIDEALEVKKEDYELYKHIYLGFVNSGVDNTFFNPLMLDFEEKDSKPYGVITIAVDPSDGGVDKHGVIIMNERYIIDIMELGGDLSHLYEVLTETISEYKKHRITLIYDAIGVGTGIGALFKHSKLDKLIPFKNSYKVKNPKGLITQHGRVTQIINENHHLNYKAQTWHEVSEDCYSNTFYFSKHLKEKRLDKLKEELCLPQRIEKNGLTMVEPKKDLLKRGILSTNLADAFIMCVSNLSYNKMKRGISPFTQGA